MQVLIKYIIDNNEMQIIIKSLLFKLKIKQIANFKWKVESIKIVMN